MSKHFQAVKWAAYSGLGFWTGKGEVSGLKMGSCLPILVADYRSSCSALFFHLLSPINWPALLSHSWPNAAWCCVLSTKLSEFPTRFVTLHPSLKVKTLNNSIGVSEILIDFSLQLNSQLQMDSRWQSTSHKLNNLLDLAWCSYFGACFSSKVKVLDKGKIK